MRFSVAFVAAALAAISSATPTKRAYDDIITDLGLLSSNVTKLDKDINAFANPPPGGLLGALGINTDSANTGTIIRRATTDVSGTASVTDDQAQNILDLFTQIKPTILHALAGIVTKKAAFQALPIGGIPSLVKTDLATLSADTKSLEAAIIAKAPATLTALVASATSLTSEIDAAFATAVAAYA